MQNGKVQLYSLTSKLYEFVADLCSVQFCCRCALDTLICGLYSVRPRTCRPRPTFLLHSAAESTLRRVRTVETIDFLMVR